MSRAQTEGSASLSLAEKLAAALKTTVEGTRTAAAAERLRGDVRDPVHRQFLRSEWRQAFSARQKRFFQWDVWWSDVGDCPLIIDGSFVRFGWAKIKTGATTIEQYFRPRPAIVASSDEIHS